MLRLLRRTTRIWGLMICAHDCTCIHIALARASGLPSAVFIIVSLGRSLDRIKMGGLCGLSCHSAAFVPDLPRGPKCRRLCGSVGALSSVT